MRCVECTAKIHINAGTAKHPICRSCHDRLGRRNAPRARVKKRRTALFAGGITLVVSVLLVAGAIRLYLSMQSPAYALRSLASAVEEGDWRKFSKFVDTERLHAAIRRYVNVRPDLFCVADLRPLMASETVEEFTTRLRDQIQQPHAGRLSFWGRLFERDLFAFAKETILENGKMVQLEIPVATEYLNIRVPVLITFRRGPLHLSLADVSIARYEEANRKIEELLSEHYNFPLQDSLSTLARLITVRKYTECELWIGSTCTGVFIIVNTRVENLSERHLARVDFEVFPGYEWFDGPIKRALRVENIAVGQQVYTGAERRWRFDESRQGDQLFLNADIDDICYKVTRIEFSDGHVIRENPYRYVDEYPKDRPSLQEIINRRERYGLSDGPRIRSMLQGAGEERL